MRALLVVPFLMGIALVVGGATSDNQTMIGIGCGLVGVAFVGFLVVLVRDSARNQAERKRIWKEGRPATARVISILQTGDMNDHPNVDMEVELRVDGAAPEKRKLTCWI